MRQWTHAPVLVTLLAPMLAMMLAGCQQGSTSDPRPSRSAGSSSPSSSSPSSSSPSSSSPSSSGSPAPALAPSGQRPATPYARDVERICYCQEHSGALERPEAERALIVAQWLGANLESDQGRDFLADVSRQGPAGKVSLLDREAQSAGLPGCPLARTWASGLPASP